MNSLAKECRRLWDKRPDLKLKYAFMSTLLFYIISSPDIYKLTNNIFKSSVNGTPTPMGLVLHSLVFMLLEFGLMNLPKDM